MATETQERETTLQTFDEMHDRCNREGWPCSYWGERGAWLVACGQSRDSDALERSNFESIRLAVEKAGGEDCYAIESETHWACGWVEHLLVNPACTAAIECVERIRERLEDYPIVDEEHFSHTEFDDYMESWESWARRDLERMVLESVTEDTADRLDCIATSYHWVDRLVDEVRDYLNWEYCGEDINLDGMLEKIVEMGEGRIIEIAEMEE